MGSEWCDVVAAMQAQHYDLLCKQDASLFSSTMTELSELTLDDTCQILCVDGPEERGVEVAVTLWLYHQIKPMLPPSSQRRLTVTTSSDLQSATGTKPAICSFYYAGLVPSCRSIKTLLLVLLNRLSLFLDTPSVGAEVALSTLSRQLVDACRSTKADQPIYLALFDLDNLFHDKATDWSWLQDLPSNVTIVTTCHDSNLTKALRRRSGYKRYTPRPFHRPQAITQCTRTLSEGMGKLVTQAQVVNLFQEHKVKRYGGLLSRITCPALEWYRWWILSSVPQIARQADEAIRHATSINRANTLVELWQAALEVVFSYLDESARRMAAECLVLLASCHTGLSVSELGLLTGVSTLTLRKVALKPLALFLALDLDTTEPLALRHPQIAQAVLEMPSFLAAASQARFEWHSSPANSWANRSLWRLFLSQTTHEPLREVRCRQELASLPKAVMQLTEGSQVDTSNLDYLIAAADPKLFPTQLSFVASSFCQHPCGFAEMLQALRCHRAFSSIDLSNNSIKDEQGQALAETLALCPKVTALRITKNSISQQGVLAMALLLPADLHVSGLEGWSSAATLAQLKEGLATSLHFDQNTPLSGDVLGFAATRLASNATLTRVTLTHQQMSDTHATDLGNALALLPQLTVLKWTRCDLNNDGILALCRGITGTTKLKQLDISRNKLRDATGTAIGKALAKGWKLQTLNLSHNLLQDKGSRGLCDGLKASSHLTTLDVSSNKYITTMGVRFIADGIRHNQSLTVFTFADNIGTGDGGASSLADAIKQSTSLREVNVSNNGITTAGTATLQQAVKASPSGCKLLL
eukprot:m.129904 g.129904  ORF g.129904 m.129904 type:complete len:812 (+) comp15862_c0_seq1:65-2500(+)